MKGFKKQRCIQIIIVVMVVLVVLMGLIGYVMCDGINFFCLFSQVVEELFVFNEVFCIGGLV